ncbi:MAG TPA: hypothetical protein VG756_03840 [Pseudonocardiaceae bacterium]|jgi:hypothetical protein|nr:hypothetical protein [Pseudonocardiaceae bacterium]
MFYEHLVIITTAVVVTAFWVGVFGVVLIVQSAKEEAAADEMRWYAQHLFGPTPEFLKPGQHRLKP